MASGKGYPIDAARRRKSVVMCYLTAEQKQAVGVLAGAVDMTQSDLMRLLLVTATPELVERLKRHPVYVAILDEELQR